MTTQALHPLAADYLARLHGTATAKLPRARAAELVDEIELHLRDALAPDATDAEVLTALDRLGDPDDIVEAEDPPAPSGADARGTHEWAAVILVLFGGFVFGVGWLAGLILLWSSRCWTAREKWLGTLLVPGGLAGGLFAALFLAMAPAGQTCSGGTGVKTVCTGGPSIAVEVLAWAALVLLLLGPIFVAIFLAKRAKTPPALR